MFSCFITIECNSIRCIVVIVIFSCCYRDRIIFISCVCATCSCTTIIYCYCFTSCVFYVVTGYVYFVSCANITEVFTSFRCNFSNIFVARSSYVCFSLYLFSRSCTTCCSRSINFKYSFTAFSFLIYSYGRTSFSFHQAIVIKFNIYVSIFTVCIVFRHSSNTVAIAFNVQLTIVCKEVCSNFISTDSSCISISTNTNANVFQLRYVDSISILVTSCYVDDLTFLSIVTNGNSTCIKKAIIPLIGTTSRCISTITNFCTIYIFTIPTNIFIIACFTSRFRTRTKRYTTSYICNLSRSTNCCCIICICTSNRCTKTNSLGTNTSCIRYVSPLTNRNAFTSFYIGVLTYYNAIGSISIRTFTNYYRIMCIAFCFCTFTNYYCCIRFITYSSARTNSNLITRFINIGRSLSTSSFMDCFSSCINTTYYSTTCTRVSVCRRSLLILNI